MSRLIKCIKSDDGFLYCIDKEKKVWVQYHEIEMSELPEEFNI
jgi:hypothetical protein